MSASLAPPSSAAPTPSPAPPDVYVSDERPPLHMLVLVGVGGVVAGLYLWLMDLPLLAVLPVLLIARAAWDVRRMRRVVVECRPDGFRVAVDSLGTRRASRSYAWADVTSTQLESVTGIYGRGGRFTVGVGGQAAFRVDERRTPRFRDLVERVNAATEHLPYRWVRAASGDDLAGYVREDRV